MGHCLVGARLICGLVMCAGWPRCSCRVSELVEQWIGYCEDDGSDWDSVDTKRTVVLDYGFPVWLGNPAMALVCPVWLGGMVGWVAALLMWLVCS